jgi:hypothetical protein
MTITYPLTFPTTIHVNGLTIQPRNAAARVESNFTFQEQVHDFDGDGWAVSGTLPLMNKNIAEDYTAFFISLRGKVGTFLFPIPMAEQRGAVSGSPLVDGASQTGRALNVKSLTPNITNIFKAGDWIQLGTGSTSSLHKVLVNANSDASGKATIDIFPKIRTSPADNAAIEIDNPKIHLRLLDDVPYSIDVNKLYIMEFNAVEVI